MTYPRTIAIDGPAASGKSTIGKRLADELGYLFFDTGVMYRAVTWLAMQTGTPVEDEASIAALAESSDIDILPPSQMDGRNCDILVNNQDVTWQIRRPEVDAHVSLVSSYGGVRAALTLQQRRVGQRGQVVMIGRDIGTVVMPEADLKIYLEASVEERARRRYLELCQRGEPADYSTILETMRKRDQFDSTRALAPLRPAPDAVIINTDGLDIEQVLDEIRRLIESQDAGKNEDDEEKI